MAFGAVMARVERKAKPVRWIGRLWRAVLVGLGLLIAVPLILVPIYGVVNPISVPMLVRTLTGQAVVREWRPLAAISDRLKATVVLSEDGNFCRHAGVDLGALRGELDVFLAGGEARGASTITMQVARNLFLWNDRSMLRKLLEVPLALYLDLVLPKSRILEIYLNIAEWGPTGQFGVEAGAMAAFGVDADALSWDRAALLTTALPNPYLRLPGAPGPGLRKVAGIVQKRAMTYWERVDCVSPDGQLKVQ